MWHQCELGEVITLKRGYDLPKQNRDPGPFPIISSAGVTGYHSAAKVKGPGVVTGRYGTLGEVFYCEQDFWPLNTSLYVQDFKGNDPRFIAYFMRNLNFVTRNAAGAVPGVNRNHLHAMQVHIPTPSIQRQIAAILSGYDDLIENNLRRIQIVEEMARVLYREWFVHFRFPGHEQLPRLASLLGDIPKGWEVKPLGEIAVITMGLSPKGDTYNEQRDGTPLINGPVEFGERFTKQEKWTTSPTKLCKEGDLVVCVRGSTTGRYVKSDGVYCLGRGVCGISSEHQCFIDQFFANELPTLLAMTGGSTFPSWTGPQLKSHRVLCPSPDLLARFEALVLPMSVAVLQYSRRIQNLRHTRDLLLPRLMSGQITLTEAAA
jgi:type I restriction enzyme S subunit